MYNIGIDIGGTKIEGILFDDSFRTKIKKRIITPSTDYNLIIKSIISLINEFKSKLYTSQVNIGICIPGYIHSKTNLVKNCNIKCMINKSFKHDLEYILQQKISVENDANCFTIAEATFGAAQDFNVVFGCVIGTGVGSGIVINKKIYRGQNNTAGEFGHHVINMNGNKCYCGNHGCVESYISGPMLEKQWTNLTGNVEPLKKIINNTNSQYWKKWKNEFLENFAVSISNIINILDPDVIVIGGGISNIDFLYNDGIEMVYKKTLSSICPPILKNKLGDSAGAFGIILI